MRAGLGSDASKGLPGGNQGRALRGCRDHPQQGNSLVGIHVGRNKMDAGLKTSSSEVYASYVALLHQRLTQQQQPFVGMHASICTAQLHQAATQQQHVSLLIDLVQCGDQPLLAGTADTPDT